MEEIDKLLKCPICFESLKTALMIINCSHTFCSLCIRKYLSYKNVCPVCNVPTYDADLKNNRLVDDIVSKFTSVRVFDQNTQFKPVKQDKVIRIKDTFPAADKPRPSSSHHNNQADEPVILSFQKKNGSQSDKTQTLSAQEANTDQGDKLQQVSPDNNTNEDDKQQEKREKQYNDSGRFTRMRKKSQDHQAHRGKLNLDVFSPKRKSGRAVTDSAILVSTLNEDFEEYLRNSNIVNLNDKDKIVHKCNLKQPSQSQTDACHVESDVTSRSPDGTVDVHKKSQRTAQYVCLDEGDQSCCPKEEGTCASTGLTERVDDISTEVRGDTGDISTDSLGSGASNKENNRNGLTMPVLSAISLDTTESLSHDEEDEDSAPLDQTTDYSTVKMPCPVCGVEVNDHAINTHLDQCLASAEKKSSLRRSTPKRKYMAKLVYNIMSEKNLRKKLKEDGLSCKGDKQTLINRHREFVLMYNAECDSLNPRPVKQLIKELETVEKAKVAGSTTSLSKQRVNIEKNSSPATIKNALQDYEMTHKSQFDELVKAARRSHRNKAKQSHGEKKSSSENISEKNEAKTGAMATTETGSQIATRVTNIEMISSSVRNRQAGSKTATPTVTNMEMISPSSSVVNSHTRSNLGIDSDIANAVVVSKETNSVTNCQAANNLSIERNSSSPSVASTETSSLCPKTNGRAGSNSGIDMVSSATRTFLVTGSSGKERTPKKVRRRIHHDNITSTPSPTKLAGLGCSPFKSPKMLDDLIVPQSPGKCALFVEDSECGSDMEDQLFKRINSSIDTFSEDDQDDDCPCQSSEWPALSQAYAPKEQNRTAFGEEEEVPMVTAVHMPPRSRHVSGLSVESGMSSGSDESSILWVSPPVTMKIGTRRRSERVKAGNEDQGKRNGKDGTEQKENRTKTMKRKRSTGSPVGGISKRVKRRR